MTELRVSVDGWFANAGYATELDANGCEWDLADIDGWFGGLATRSLGSERPRGDGSIDGAVLFGARRVTLTGNVSAPTPDTLQVAMDRIAAVLVGSDRSGTLLVDEKSRGLARTSFCRLDVQGRAKRTGELTADWQLTLFCPDPVRYDATRVNVSTPLPQAGTGLSFPVSFPASLGAPNVSGRMTLPNAGTAPYRPVFTVRGPVPDFTITDLGSGRALTYVDSLDTDADFLVLDNDRRRVLLQGTTDRRGSLSVARWIEVPPGGTTLSWSSSTTNTQASLSAMVPVGAYW